MIDPKRKYGEMHLDNEEDIGGIVTFGQAVSNRTRVDLLRLVNHHPRTITELSHLLFISTSAVLFHVKLLEDAHLVSTASIVGKGAKRETRLIASNIRTFLLDFAPPLGDNPQPPEEIVYEMPVGAYTRFHCFSRYAAILDGGKTTREIYAPERFGAFIVWCDKGYAEYEFPCAFFRSKRVRELDISLECCAEAPQFRIDWKSDITFSIEGIELATYTSPSDFGEKRGRLTPAWWSSEFTQYGQLVHISVTDRGCFLNGERVSDVVLADLGLDQKEKFVFRVECKENARNAGGFNLFGKHFGDYAQDIVMTAVCDPPKHPV